MTRAKKGDMALIVGCMYTPEHNGKVVEVTTDPTYVRDGFKTKHWYSPLLGAGLFSGVRGLPPGCEWIPTNRLIPLPPNAPQETEENEHDIEA